MKVLFACIHNSGRSVAAEVLLSHHSSFEVFSAGSAPSTSVNPAVAAVLAERGLSAVGHAPTLLTPALVGDVESRVLRLLTDLDVAPDRQ